MAWEASRLFIRSCSFSAQANVMNAVEDSAPVHLYVRSRLTGRVLSLMLLPASR